MIDLATVGLLTAGVKLANEVISLFASSRRLTEQRTAVAIQSQDVQFAAPIPQFAGQPDAQVIERTSVYRETTTVVVERALDKEFMEKIVREAVSSLDSLIKHSAEVIVDELRRARVRDAVQEVKARASALRILMNATELDTALVIQMLTGALNPLQVSLEKARYVLEDYGDKESWDYCYLVGTTALLAGYNFLGQRPGYLEDELLRQARSVHSAILDKIASVRVKAGVPIPWQEVPALLEPSGADALRTLYEETMAQDNSTDPAALPFDVVSLSVDQIRRNLREVQTVEAIEKMIDIEKGGPNRGGALDALYKRRKTLRG